jgi:hypothetical protein
MAVTQVVLVQAKQVENSQTTQYTAAATTKAIIDKFTVTNNSAANVKFSCNLVEISDTPADRNLIVNEREITPEETYNCPELIGHDLDPGDFISTLADTASALTMRVSGREIT